METIMILVGLMTVFVILFKVKKHGVSSIGIPNPFEAKEGEYSHIQVCPKCRNVLSDKQIYYAMGRCAHCGHKEKGAGTITETEDVIIRYSRDCKQWLTVEQYADRTKGFDKKKQTYTREEMIEELKKYREFVWRNGATVADLQKHIDQNNL